MNSSKKHRKRKIIEQVTAKKPSKPKSQVINKAVEWAAFFYSLYQQKKNKLKNRR